MTDYFSTLVSVLTTVWSSATSNDVAEFFSLVIIFAFALFIWKQFHRPGHDFRNEAATILTSLGVTGTFVGILFALQKFNVDNIVDDLPAMLDGLKVAFVTSVIGISCSVMFQVLAFYPKRAGQKLNKGSDETKDRDINDLYRIMEKSFTAQTELSNRIGGDDDKSLTGQIEKMRLSQRDFTDDLFKKLDEFVNQMAKGATEQIIDALKNVIVDFNNKLTEQFGENFKELNRAVLKLVDWQENYKQQLEEMRIAFDTSVRAIDESKLALAQIVQSAESIPKTMDKLKPVLDGVNHQINELETHLAVFQEMRNAAVAAVPEMQDHVRTIVDDISNASKETTQKVGELATITQSTFGEFQRTATAASANLTEATGQASINIVAMATEVSEQTQTMTESMMSATQDIQETIRDGHEQVQTSIANMITVVTETQQEASLRMQEALTTNVANLETQFSEMLISITAAQSEASSKLAESINVGTQGIAHTLEEAGSRITQETTAGVLRLQNQFSSVLEDLTEHQTNAQRGISEKADEFRQTIQQKLGEVQSELTQLASNLNEEQTKTSQTLRTASENIAQTVNSSSVSMEQSVNTISEKISGALAQAQNAINEHTKSISERMDEAAQKHFSAVQKSIEDSQGSVRSSMESSFSNFDRQISDTLEGIVTELGQALTRISLAMVEDITELQTVTRALRDQRAQERDKL